MHLLLHMDLLHGFEVLMMVFNQIQILCVLSDLCDLEVTKALLHLAGNELPQRVGITQIATGTVSPGVQPIISCNGCCASIYNQQGQVKTTTHF